MPDSLLIDILCASANSLLLDGLGHLVSLGNFRVVGQAEDVGRLLTCLRICNPAVLVLDLDLTVKEANLVLKCRMTNPGLKVLILQGSKVSPTLSPDIAAADAFLDRTQTMATLAKRLKELAS